MRQDPGVTFHISDRMGAATVDPDLATIDRVLAELDEPVDDEHPDVSLTHESGWCLSAFPSGLLVWEHLDENAPRHMHDVPRETVRRLWLALAVGDLATIEREHWAPGYF